MAVKRKSRVGGKVRKVAKAKKGKSKKPNHDACYHQVKARYKVFSAYASGAIAKCRKRRAGKKK